MKKVLGEGFELPRGHEIPDRTDKNPIAGWKIVLIFELLFFVADKNTNDFWVKGCLCKSLQSQK